MPGFASPSLSDFQETASGFRHISFPGITDLVSIQGIAPALFPFLLDSAVSGPNARYSILLGRGQQNITLTAAGQLLRNGKKIPGLFLDALKAQFHDAGIATTDPLVTDLPFIGGWFVFLSYELAGEIEPSLPRRPAAPTGTDGLPVAVAARAPYAIVVDQYEQTTAIVAEDDIDGDTLESVLALLRTPPAESQTKVPIRTITEEPAQIYLAAIARTLRYIREGDIFQANLSRLWRAETHPGVTPFDIYRRLHEINPAPFAGLALLDDGHAIISSSPERLISVRKGEVSTRPIAGTHPRGDTAATDRRLSDRLLAHPKERAEHVMLIDLERNDLGRVCQPGSVRVAELMALETYPHVHHIVSEVRGTLYPDVDPVDVIRAVFPGGTITGCPKVRCMEIIDELEHSTRGAYTGSMGYINRDGSMDLNILIRTMVARNRQIQFRAGAGIVADSDPQGELDETRAKARGLLRALGTDIR